MRALARPLRSSGTRLKDNSGQAVVEYMLVLVVTIGIIMGVMYQFNSAFKKYVQSYFGEYVACLLETGEMPSLGGEGGANAEACSSSFEPFSLANGRPMSPGAGGNGDEKGSGSSGGRSPSGGRVGASRNGALRAAKITRNMSTRNADGSSSSSSSGASEENKKRVSRKGATSNPSYSMRTNRMREQGQIPLSSSFSMGGMQKDKKSFTARINPAGKKGSEGSSNRGRIKVDPQNFRKVASEEGSLELGLSFGDYIRYIIIFGLIVMIIVFFGGQLFQLKKGYNS